MQVESQLLRNALGYEYVEEKNSVKYIDGKATGFKETYKRYQRPDTTAQIFWLKNRRPDLWRDRYEQSISGEFDGVEINILNHEQESD